MANRTSQRSSSCHLDNRKPSKLKHTFSAISVNKNESSHSEIVRLKVEEDMIEKSLKSLMISSFKHLEPHHVKEYENKISDLERKRSQEQQHLQEQMNFIKRYLVNMEKEIENVDSLDLEKFKESLMDLEGKFAVLKSTLEKQKTLLKHQERGYNENVSSMSNKIDDWAKPIRVSAALAKIRHSAISSAGCSFNESVNTFQKFLREKGGHTGGWDEADHLIYLRFLQKYQSKQTVFKHLQEEFPDKSLKELCEHDQWYAEYGELKAKQRESIAKWRENKNHCVRRTVSCSEQISEVLIKEPKREDIFSNDYREQQKQQIERWRNMKRLEMELKNLKKEEEQHKRVVAEEAKKMRHAMQKAELERYKEEKIKREVAHAQEKESIENIKAEERAITANKSIKCFRQRDAEALARQRLLKERLEKERDAKEKILESLRQKVRVEVQRDPHRLFKPTGAWKERTKAKRDNEVSLTLRPAVPLNLKEVPRLGIPVWRQNRK